MVFFVEKTNSQSNYLKQMAMIVEASIKSLPRDMCRINGEVLGDALTRKKRNTIKFLYGDEHSGVYQNQKTNTR